MPRVLAQRTVSALVDTVTAVLLAYPSPATPERVLDALTAPDLDALGLADAAPLVGLVEALDGMAHRGDLRAVPGGYATAFLPIGISNRQRALSLCGRTAIALERAVRVSDVWSYVEQHAPDEIRVAGLTLGRLTRGLCSLKETGTVVAVAVTQGDSTKGRNLLVPRAILHSGVEWTPKEPLAWLDYVRG
jgi:hypothetical protein